jgi:hypothetical protein
MASAFGLAVGSLWSWHSPQYRENAARPRARSGAVIVNDDGAAVLAEARGLGFAIGFALAVSASEVLAVGVAEELAAEELVGVVLVLGVVAPAAAAGASPGRSSRRVQPTCNATARIRWRAPNELRGMGRSMAEGRGRGRRIRG